MKKHIVFSMIGTISVLASLNADIDVRLTKTTVGINESFAVDFISKQKIYKQPDFSPLMIDFEILSSGQNHSTKVINGQADTEIKWHFVLQPKRQGQLIIPVVAFDKEYSPAKTIEVTGPREIQQDDSIFLETEISPTDGTYEQSQLIYTARLYRSVNLARAGLSPLKVDDPDAIIEPLGEDVEYEYFHPNGRRYAVLERKYAVFPQRSGVLNFSPIIFEGNVLTGGNSFFFHQSEFKRVSSGPLQVTIKPKPPEFQKNNWFSAYNVKVAEEWSADFNQITVGEPITWTLTLTAEGCLGSQIPALPLDFPPSIKQYQDKAEISNAATPQGIIGMRQIKVALIATKAGELTIPAISIPWWDLKHNRPRNLNLPEQTVRVKEAQIALNTPSDTVVVSNFKEEKSPVVIQEEKFLIPLWVWGLVSLNGIWVAGLIRKLYRNMKLFSFKKSPKSASLRHIRGKLKKACYNNNAKQAEAFLLAWATIINPNAKPQNLMQLKQYLSEDLQKPINDLYEALYASQKAWHGNSLWQAFKSFQGQPNKESACLKDQLHKLYDTKTGGN